MREQQRGWLDTDKVERLAASVRTAGIAVLERAIPTSDLDFLALRMDYDSANQIVTSKWKERRGFGSTEAHDELSGGHAQQGLPRTAPWVLPSIVCNPLLEQCAIALLGPCYFQTNNGNTNLPGSGTQPLHVDASWDVDENGQPEPLQRLSFFIPMRDVTPENGSTEIWLGSHNDLSWVPARKAAEKHPNAGQPDAETQDAQRHRLPPTQVAMPKGAVLLRDARGWHRGMPNQSNQPRHLVTVAYASQAVPFQRGASGSSMRYSESCRDAFSRSGWPAGAFEEIHGSEQAPLVRNDIAVEFIKEERVDHYGNTSVSVVFECVNHSLRAVARQKNPNQCI